MTGPFWLPSLAGALHPGILVSATFRCGGPLPNLPDTIGPEELSRLLGLSERAVRDLAKEGTLKRLARGQYALHESVTAYCGRLRESAAGRSGETLAAERVKLTRAKAEFEAIKIARLRGEVVDAAAVEREWADILRGLKTSLLALPGRVQQRIPHLSRDDVSELETEVRSSLELLANGK